MTVQKNQCFDHTRMPMVPLKQQCVPKVALGKLPCPPVSGGGQVSLLPEPACGSHQPLTHH